MFGPSQKEIWSDVASVIGADFKNEFLQEHAIHYCYKEWEIILKSYSRKDDKKTRYYTKATAQFVSKDGFSFKIYRKNIFTNIGKLLGLQDIIIGDEIFDKNFVIKSSDEFTAKLFFDHDMLKDLIKVQDAIELSIETMPWRWKNKYPKDVNQLYFVRSGIMKDKEMILQLFKLFECTLDHLVHIDAAHGYDPKSRFV